MVVRVSLPEELLPVFGTAVQPDFVEEGREALASLKWELLAAWWSLGAQKNRRMIKS